MTEKTTVTIELQWHLPARRVSEEGDQGMKTRPTPR